MEFNQVLTAMVTPFNDQDEINYDETKRLIDYLIDNGTEGIVAVGTTGESPTLSHDEKLSFLRFVVNYVNKRVPVIAGTGSNNTKQSIALSKEAEEIGVDGIMLVTPYYNKPSQEGMYQHFKTIAEAITLPVMLYNIPGRTVVRLELETVLRLAEVKNIVAIKEATGDLDLISQIIKETPDDFIVYSGDDNLLLPILSLGGSGIVSVASHIVGNEMSAMVKAYTAGDVVTATKIQQEIAPVIKALFSAPNPSAVKYALNKKGLNVGHVRLPLIALNEAEKADVDDVVGHLY
ncbi:4-hydroxy-tetrahydrodipicolinate synthase [Halolactibacillus alkaliphilus]|uniref:4-hydroxy-tetrahydrodipicolinate synthase n=1 Tax=Halolactibacillus alkaliphilus TaxID=442899 RepID=A0A511WZV2_9BACI|nr:4-hydroxy-tetrahydrodipicolinate synthase [Halolactibacillus alkaliphilus]GEN56224.1 4-hydroxy-tetrahydrodipicolinate synthase [Halolactibacillus alkaliphilus]GGN66503.1 4-hydroxy-tetrahydrodipicolinate synthase [Halolactibacillus alkaliphilus]SFO67738.1 4-hydroxy-tetrahydrodipicolinate synthase [Halolactibacillus alkaliphilus]